jgi:pimeloyl-ACP methyl ester carboxylesterase
VIDGHEVHYWRSGGPDDRTTVDPAEQTVDDPVLVLHGLGGDHQGLAELAAALMGASVIIPDLPGYGTSAELTGEHSLAGYADFVERFRQHLGLRRFQLVGHSLGASIALVYAGRYPTAVAHLGLLNPVSTANNLTANLGKLYYRIGAWLPTGLARLWLASRLAVYLADAMIIVTTDRARRRWILEQDYENYRRASVRAMVESYLSYDDTPFEECAAAITAPTLLVTGDRDSIGPVASINGLADRIADAEVRIVPGGGHLLPMERPRAVAGLINEFRRARTLVDTTVHTPVDTTDDTPIDTAANAAD